MITVQWIAGFAVLLFGHELSYVFSGIMAGYLGLRLTHLLPPTAPAWADLALIAVLAVIAASLTMINKDVGFYITGSLAGGFLASSYFAPNTLTIPLIPFIIGAVLVSLFIGLLKGWGVIIVSCAVGTYLLYGVIPLFGTARTLASAGAFIVGGVVQVVLFQMQKHSEE